MRLPDTMKQIFKEAVVLSMFILAACGPRDRYVTITGYAQGGTYSVKFNMNGRDGMIKENPQVIKDSVDAVLTAIDN